MVYQLQESTLHVLFVCTGNICRSPTAERLLAAHAQRLGISTLTTSSAGARAVIGHPIHPDAATVLRELGGDTSGFAARQLTQRIASEADLILTMTRRHRDTVLEIAPQQLRRTFTLREAALLIEEQNARVVADLATLRAHVGDGAFADVLDPIGQGADVFAAVGAQIAALLPPVVELCRRSAVIANE